jgi:hypothetical protein
MTYFKEAESASRNVNDTLNAMLQEERQARAGK